MEAVLGARVLHVDVLKGEKVLGSLAGWPRSNLGRGNIRAWFNGLLADGTVLDEGTYRVRIKAIRVFGDEKKDEDWDVATSVEFNVRYS